MRQKTDLVVLKITYDADEVDPPQAWPWGLMVDPDALAIEVLPALPSPEVFARPPFVEVVEPPPPDQYERGGER